MLDLFGAAGFEAVSLAVEMGVFDALADGESDAVELAERLDADAKGVRALLHFLEAQGYVASGDGRYRNTSMTAKWLTTESETNMAPWFTFWNDLVFPFWECHLETVVREGEPPLTIYEWFDEEPSRWELAQRGFRAAASVLVDAVADEIAIPDDASRLLDVGGGHGLYSIELCRRHPRLSGVVFDSPEALAVAREEIEDAGVEDRLRTRGGDYSTDDFGGAYDVALVFNVTHAHDAAETQHLFERVFDTLDPGGRIVVLDQFQGSASTPVGETALQFVGLTYLTTLGATIHPYDDVAEWLRDIGFEDLNRTSIRRAGPGNTLIQATKPKNAE